MVKILNKSVLGTFDMGTSRGWYLFDSFQSNVTENYRIRLL